MSISLRQIRYFVSTAEHGQVSHAALDLAISPSAITTAIQQIERAIGADLFVRSPQGMDLTPTGLQFLFHAYDILNKVVEATSLSIPANDLYGNRLFSSQSSGEDEARPAQARHPNVRARPGGH